MNSENFQSELHYDFDIPKLENFPLFIQSVLLPGIFTEAPQTGTQFSPIKHVGDSLFFQDLYVTIKLDDAMATWFEIFKWLTGLTRSETYQQFIDLVGDKVLSLDETKKLFKSRELDPTNKGYKNIKSNGVLTINDANHLPYMNLMFSGLHPTSMSGFTFRTDSSNVQFITYDVTFAYNFYYPTAVK